MRDKKWDKIFLKNFFNEKIAFFTREQPVNADIYLFGHSNATSDWYPLKREIDTYALNFKLKQDLDKFFELAEKYAYHACSDQPFRSSAMSEKWEHIRKLAKEICSTAKCTGVA